jgi:hypothetical protein
MSRKSLSSTRVTSQAKPVKLVRNPQGDVGARLCAKLFLGVDALMKTTRKYLNRGVGGHRVLATIRFPKYLTPVGRKVFLNDLLICKSLQHGGGREQGFRNDPKFPSNFSGGGEGTRFNRSDYISKAIQWGGGEGTGPRPRVFEIISFPSHFVGEVGVRRMFDASCESYMILQMQASNT